METNSLSPSLQFCIGILKASATLGRRFDSRLGGFHGLSLSDFVLLLHLHRAPAERLRRVDLADQLGLTASAVTRQLLPLEKIGLVRRKADRHDARVTYAVLTKAGQRVLGEALETAESISREVVPSSERLPELEKLLSAIAKSKI